MLINNVFRNIITFYKKQILNVKKNLLACCDKSTIIFLFKLTQNFLKFYVNSKMHSLNLLQFYFQYIKYVHFFIELQVFIFSNMIRYNYFCNVVKMVIIHKKNVTFDYKQVVQLETFKIFNIIVIYYIYCKKLIIYILNLTRKFFQKILFLMLCPLKLVEIGHKKKIS